MQIGQRYYGVASVLALLLAVPSAPVNADGTTDVYSRNDDGTFSPTATYLVDHDEAIAAYELSPAFQAEGGGTLYSTMPDGTRVRIGSGVGFVQFLEDNYARAGGVATSQACDDFVRIIWKFSCPGQCRVDPVDCGFAFKVEPQIMCKDIPECPPVGKTTCADFPDRIDTIRVIGPGMEVCFCDANNNDCVVGQGFMVDEFTTKGPICECVEERKPPSDPLEPCQNHWAPDPGGAKRNRTGCFKMPASAGGQQVTIRVTLDRLYIDENKDPVNGCPVRPTGLPDLSLFEGQVRFLGPPSAFDDNSVVNPRFIAAKLQCTQFFRDWSPAALAAEFPAADTRQIYYYGTEVFPCSIHDLQQATENCKETANPEDCFSAPLVVRTSLWGDVWDPFENVNFTDIGKVVDAFKSIPFIKGPPPSGAPRKVRAMLRGNSVPLGSSVNFTDIGRCVNAFKTIGYKELGPSAEICDDGIDNNCNGAIDEDGAPCTVPAGNGVCMAGVCVVP